MGQVCNCTDGLHFRKACVPSWHVGLMTLESTISIKHMLSESKSWIIGLQAKKLPKKVQRDEELFKQTKKGIGGVSVCQQKPNK